MELNLERWENSKKQLSKYLLLMATNAYVSREIDELTHLINKIYYSLFNSHQIYGC